MVSFRRDLNKKVKFAFHLISLGIVHYNDVSAILKGHFYSEVLESTTYNFNFGQSSHLNETTTLTQY